MKQDRITRRVFARSYIALGLSSFAAVSAAELPIPKQGSSLSIGK